jgi:chlorite dismutase
MEAPASGPMSVAFVAGPSGEWRVDRLSPVRGESLPMAAALARVEGRKPETEGSIWILRGTTSHARYVTRDEKTALEAVQPGLGRQEADRAALIPIRKSAEWWALAQDERRALFEEQSRHIATGMEYLPAVARRLYHARDRGEPFDFLTWFEYSSADAARFEELVRRLRETEEWTYVEREVDLRLSRRR